MKKQNDGNNGNNDQPKGLTFDFSDPRLFNRKFIPLLHNKSEFLHLWGAAGSSKSWFAAQREVIESFSPRRQDRKTIVVRKIYNTLRDSCYSTLKSVIYGWGFDKYFSFPKSPLRIINEINRVEFLFRGMDDPEKIKSIANADRIWYEEATESESRNEIDQLRLRLRGYKDVQITLSYNPIDENHWINREIHEKKEKGHFLHHSVLADNEWLMRVDPQYAKFIQSTRITNPNYYRIYGLGLWGSILEGLIYDNFDIIPEFTVGQDETINPIQFYGLDFGYSDPTALVGMRVEDALPKKKLQCKEILYKTGLDAPALIREFTELKIPKDRYIIADSARPEMIKSLRDVGYQVLPSKKASGSVLSGINFVRKFQLQIIAGSSNLIKELRNYQKNQTQGIWQEEPKPNQVDHACDAMRYGAEHLNKTPWRQMEFQI